MWMQESVVVVHGVELYIMHFWDEFSKEYLGLAFGDCGMGHY